MKKPKINYSQVDTRPSNHRFGSINNKNYCYTLLTRWRRNRKCYIFLTALSIISGFYGYLYVVLNYQNSAVSYVDFTVNDSLLKKQHYAFENPQDQQIQKPLPPQSHGISILGNKFEWRSFVTKIESTDSSAIKLYSKTRQNTTGQRLLAGPTSMPQGRDSVSVTGSSSIKIDVPEIVEEVNQHLNLNYDTEEIIYDQPKPHKNFPRVVSAAAETDREILLIPGSQNKEVKPDDPLLKQRLIVHKKMRPIIDATTPETTVQQSGTIPAAQGNEVRTPEINLLDSNQSSVYKAEMETDVSSLFGGGNSNGRMACKLPVLQPFAPSILPYIETPEPIECVNQLYPLLFELDDDCTLVQLDKSQKYGLSHCCYTSFSRTLDMDDEAHISDVCIPIKKTRTVIPYDVTDFIVSCRNVTSNKVDIDVFSLPRLTPSDILQRTITEEMTSSRSSSTSKSKSKPKSKRLLNPIIEKRKNQKLNVVILGLDALSNMNFQRTMPLSRNYLLSQLNASSFDGYTKVGDNTLPNALAFLTGKSRSEINGTCYTSDFDYFNDCPFIWKNFAAKGYFTSYLEDDPFISTFNGGKLGFKEPPVDFYGRTSLLRQESLVGHELLSNGNICYGPRLSFQVLLKNMRNLAYSIRSNSGQQIFDKGSRTPLTTPTFNYFQVVWSNPLFHDYSELPALGDGILLESLKWFKDGGYLNDTVFIVMSDHGIRWGPIRETAQGKIEERMPHLHIALPPWFPQKYPKAAANMANNKPRLTTHFDLHETFLDLLEPDLNLSDESVERRSRQLLEEAKNGNGGKFSNTPPRTPISLFLSIPLSRNCADAGIDPHWCVCQTSRAVDKRAKQVLIAARAIVKYINGKLQKFPACAELSLKDVLGSEVTVQKKISEFDNETDSSKDMEKQDSEFSLQNEILGMSNREIVKQRHVWNSQDPSKNVLDLDIAMDISLRTSPGLAMFEATVSRNFASNNTLSWTVGKDISRTNRFNKQSHCVKNSIIKLFCYCKDQIH